MWCGRFLASVGLFEAVFFSRDGDSVKIIKLFGLERCILFENKGGWTLGVEPRASREKSMKLMEKACAVSWKPRADVKNPEMQFIDAADTFCSSIATMAGPSSWDSCLDWVFPFADLDKRGRTWTAGVSKLQLDHQMLGKQNHSHQQDLLAVYGTCNQPLD